MVYTHEQLSSMSYDELCNVSISDMPRAPVRGLGFPPIYIYACKGCGERLEGSSRSVRNMKTAKPVKCPYCAEILWTRDGGNALRLTAYKQGHFERERKKRWLKDLKDDAKRKEIDKVYYNVVEWLNLKPNDRVELMGVTSGTIRIFNGENGVAYRDMKSPFVAKITGWGVGDNCREYIRFKLESGMWFEFDLADTNMGSVYELDVMDFLKDVWVEIRLMGQGKYDIEPLFTSDLFYALYRKFLRFENYTKSYDYWKLKHSVPIDILGEGSKLELYYGYGRTGVRKNL